MYSGGQKTKFQRNLLPPPSVALFNDGVGSLRIYRSVCCITELDTLKMEHVGTYLPNYAVSHPENHKLNYPQFLQSFLYLTNTYKTTDNIIFLRTVQTVQMILFFLELSKLYK